MVLLTPHDEPWHKLVPCLGIFFPLLINEDGEPGDDTCVDADFEREVGVAELFNKGRQQFWRWTWAGRKKYLHMRNSHPLGMNATNASPQGMGSPYERPRGACPRTGRDGYFLPWR